MTGSPDPLFLLRQAEQPTVHSEGGDRRVHSLSQFRFRKLIIGGSDLIRQFWLRGFTPDKQIKSRFRYSFYGDTGDLLLVSLAGGLCLCRDEGLYGSDG